MVSGTIPFSRNKRYCSVMGRAKRLDVGGTIHHALGEVPDTISLLGRNGSWEKWFLAPFLPGTVRQRLRAMAGKC
jgi:hypothetical protein